MLEFLRTAAQTWVVKGLLVILVLSFMVWGGSSLTMTNQSDAVVVVGDVKVKAPEFRLTYETMLAQASRQLGTRLTPAVRRQQVRLVKICCTRFTVTRNSKT